MRDGTGGGQSCCLGNNAACFLGYLVSSPGYIFGQDSAVSVYFFWGGVRSGEGRVEKFPRHWRQLPIIILNWGEGSPSLFLMQISLTEVCTGGVYFHLKIG